MTILFLLKLGLVFIYITILFLFSKLCSDHEWNLTNNFSGDLEYRARSIIYKEKLANLVAEDARVPAPHQSLEAAYRYLVMAFDISETVYGPYHPMVNPP